MNCQTGWCGRGEKQRVFTKRKPLVCYDKPAAAIVNTIKYGDIRLKALTGEKLVDILVPKKSAKAWTMEEGDLCRITVIEGPQVGDLNFWNLENPKEHFYSGKTRQIHSSHLTVWDRLWSCIPYIRPMATVVGDSLKYGIDEDGAGCHDVIGTRCDQYTMSAIKGATVTGRSCHSQLTAAVVEYNLTEENIHDVWNIFMCTGFSRDTHQYFCKASPAEKGDYVEFIADMNLIVALSTCPQGDVSTPVGQEVPDEKCYPLKVEVFRGA